MNIAQDEIILMLYIYKNFPILGSGLVSQSQKIYFPVIKVYQEGAFQAR